MGLIDKIMFWKKKEDNFDMPDLDMPDFSKDFGDDENTKSPDIGLPPSDDTSSANIPNSNPGINAPPHDPSIPNFDTNTNIPNANNTLPPVNESEQFMTHSTNPMQAQNIPANPNSQSQKIVSDKEVQLISAKLDTLKAQLDGISHRIAHIEKLATESQGEKKDDLW